MGMWDESPLPAPAAMGMWDERPLPALVGMGLQDESPPPALAGMGVSRGLLHRSRLPTLAAAHAARPPLPLHRHRFRIGRGGAWQDRHTRPNRPRLVVRSIRPRRFIR